jgi:hypothetical protein
MAKIFLDSVVPLIATLLGGLLVIFGTRYILPARENVFEIAVSDLDVGRIGAAVAPCPDNTRLLGGVCSVSDDLQVMVSGPLNAVKSDIKRYLEIVSSHFQAADPKGVDVEGFFNAFNDAYQRDTSKEGKSSFYCLAVVAKKVPRVSEAPPGTPTVGFVTAKATCLR